MSYINNNHETIRTFIKLSCIGYEQSPPLFNSRLHQRSSGILDVKLPSQYGTSNRYYRHVAAKGMN